MHLVETVHPLESLTTPISGFRRHTLTLSWEERCQGHGKRQSDQGFEFAISLPYGTVLKQDDCLILELRQLVICVNEAKEPVYLIHPTSPREWAYYAYQLGNRHQPLMIADQALICLANSATRSLLHQLKISCQEASQPFNSARLMTGHSH